MNMNELDECADAQWLPPATNNCNRKTVNWRGNQVFEKEGIALKNLFDDLLNYFGQPVEDPTVTFIIDSLNQSYCDDETGASKTTLLTIWKGSLKFMYKVNYKNRVTSQKLDYMSMDVCIDLTPKKKLNFGGHDMKDYCRTWVYAHAPKYTIETVIRYFEDGTGFKASSKGLILDENRNIVHFEAKLLADPQTEPSFWVTKDDDNKEFACVGTVREASQDPLYQIIVRGIGIFTVTAEVARNSNDGSRPIACGEDEACLSFSLVSLRTTGFVNNLAPVVYDPRHCTECIINDDLIWWE